MAENILDIMVALYTFKAQNDTELSFSKGERLEVIDRPPSDPDWFKARNTSAQIGLVPKNYLVELSQYLTQDVGKLYLKLKHLIYSKLKHSNSQ